MKKLVLPALVYLIPFVLQAQVCVTLYRGDNFGLNDVESTINELEIDNSGTVWFGLKTSWGGYGVGKLNGSIWSSVSTSFLPDPRCSGIAFDKQDSVWIGTMKGLGIIHRNTLEGRKMTTANSLLPESNVTAIAIDSNNIKWIGFSSGKVASFDGVTFTEHKEWNNSPVNDIEIAFDSSVWVGLGDSPGIAVYKDGVWNLNSIVRSVPSIESDKWGRVMVASGDSMIIYVNGNINIVHASAGNSLRDIAVGDNSGIWASSGEGLLLRSGRRFVSFSNINSAVPSQLSDPIAIDQENQLWFGYTYLVGSNGFSAAGFLYRAPAQETAEITADKPSLVFCYGDSLTLEAEPDKVNYVWPDGANTSAYTLFDADTVEVAVEADNRCYYYDTVRVNVQKVYEEEKVCAVSVDTNGRNIIIWEKTPEVGTRSFNIYRELTTDSFMFVRNIPFNRLSVFEDADVDPTVQSVKYKISAVDTCGNESGQSFYHRTLHLQLSKGLQDGEINLDWSAYEGLNFPHYVINRGNSPDNVTPLTTVPNDVLKYTDKGVSDTIYYRISIPLPEECNPSGEYKAGTGPYVHALSNMDDNKLLLTGYRSLHAVNEIRAYPNPFREFTRIEFSNPGNIEYRLKVYNVSGQLVRDIRSVTGNEVYLRRENLDPGYYVFELNGEKLFRGNVVIR